MTDRGEQPALMTDRVLPVSLTICSRNRPQLLLETVQSVLECDALPAEFLIIDQSSVRNERFADLPAPHEGCSIRYVWSRSAGLSRARDEGVDKASDKASYDVLVFIDDDMWVRPDWLRTIVRTQYKAGRRVAVSGRVLPGGGEVPGAFVPSLKEDAEGAVYSGRVAADVLYTNNMAIWRDAFHTVGYFDERLGTGTLLPSSEDNDLCYRLLEAGYQIIYTPDAVVYHRAWRHEYLRLRWSYGVGQGAFYAKHASLRGDCIRRNHTLYES